MKLTIILESPPAGVDYGLQKGSGSIYETVQKQRSSGGDLRFDFEVEVKPGSVPDFRGPFVQGKAGERFVYLDIGRAAGQHDTEWSRRLKVPLRGISREMADSGAALEARVYGTARDGSPACASVKDFEGWRVVGA